MDEWIEISLLLDFYGNLLTSKQKDIMDLYFNKDLSLKEISELTNTSRQAVHDITKRCCSTLLDYEKKLQLMKKNYEKEQTQLKIRDKLLYIEKKLDKDSVIIDKINEIKEELEKI